MADNADATPEKPVLSEKNGQFCKLTLNRPHRLNALTADLLRLLQERLLDCATDDSIRAVVMTGAGKAFCAGQDLADRDPRKLKTPLDLEAIQRELFHPIVTLIRSMTKPVVVALNGIAAGAGSSLALAGDILLVGRSARLVQSFAKVGLSVDAGGGWHLVRTLGAARARALLLTGGDIDAAEGERLGLFWRVVADDDLQQHAEALAGQLASGPTVALGAIKQAIEAAQSESDHAAYLKTEARLQGMAGQTADYREGVLAFLEKRAPQFRGH